MSEAVLDSSAVLALLLGEPGADKIKSALPDALLSTVNFAEVISKLCERGMPITTARLAVETIGVEIVNFDVDQACEAGNLRNSTKAAGLSLGDRACLALARLKKLPAMTADKAWGQIAGLDVTLIRGPTR